MVIKNENLSDSITISDSEGKTVTKTVSDSISLSDSASPDIIIITAQTQQPMPQDPATSLKQLLQAYDASKNPLGMWGSSGSNLKLPAASMVNVDIKWGPSGMHNRILIKNMPRLVSYEQLGGTRTRTRDIKMIQVWCDTQNAVQNKWLIEEEIKRIIAASKLSLQSLGIDEISFQRGFEDIEIQDPVDMNTQVGRGGYLARSDCLVKMIYDESLIIR